MANREAREAFLLKYIKKIAPKSKNAEFYKAKFAKMSDDEFNSYVDDIASGKKVLGLVCPNFIDSGLSVGNNMEIAKELGHSFFQKLWIEGSKGVPSYLTPIEYMVLDVPVRRASQLLDKKISVPDSNRVVDSMTGQATGASKGAKISYPELQLCAAMGLENTMVELMKYRGGDSGGMAALNGMLVKYGTANQLR